MKFKDLNQRVNNVFDNYVKINSRMFRYMGLVIEVKDNTRDRKSQILERIPTIIINILSLIAAFFQIQWIIDLWDYDKDLVTQITTSGISNIVCICKGFRLAYCREDLQRIFEKLRMIWNKNSLHKKMQEEIIRKAQNTLIFCKCYICMMLGLGICFGLPPLKDFLFQYLVRNVTDHTYDYSKRVFLVRYPFKITSTWIYTFVLLEEEWILFYSALYWVCCDTLFAQLTTHTCLLFEILQFDIESTIKRENDEINMKDNIISFIKRHCELLGVCELVESIFSPVLFTTMLLTSINICVNVFELRKMIEDDKYTDAILHSFHLINIFFQLLVYCIFAERLTQQVMYN